MYRDWKRRRSAARRLLEYLVEERRRIEELPEKLAEVIRDVVERGEGC